MGASKTGSQPFLDLNKTKKKKERSTAARIQLGPIYNLLDIISLCHAPFLNS